ncbi:aminotransferase class V-fold PLP-dependent enzyme [Acrocarpospora catenulata]|uniref:aminotransferase class V-fold PLP-dependent enzyme n=1 Tax=Acrocarpospora catenulata TaxID=2836182 RepID=UPI0027E15256|nr:aminotransferase class V-fold PLP-dependent enzyme [Acrocarpospora catenulata]
MGLRAGEYSYLDERGHVYLDYTGSGLPSRHQLRAHAERVAGGCFGNPHSENPTSLAATALVERARAAILSFFNAPSDEYAVIFTANATGACRLVGEAYPFGPGTRLVLTSDNHNSVNGIREYARTRGAAVTTVGLVGPELRVDDGELLAALDSRTPGLLAFPAQSNFTGVRHPLRWVAEARDRGYDVLLDAAAFVPTNRLDLSVVQPDFVPVSWYKVFGYPTGVGCLIARREALARLVRPWFAGGTIKAVSALGNWHVLNEDETAFEDGTLNFHSIPDVEVGLSWIAAIGIEAIHSHVTALTGALLTRLQALRHRNGVPFVQLYGPATMRDRGATVAFNFRTPSGDVVDEREVARAASAAGISLRTGCFCNPGAGERAFSIDEDLLAGPYFHADLTLDDYLHALGLPSGGAIRVSLGLASNLTDIDRFLDFATTTYLNREPDYAGLAPRLRC